MPLFTSRLPSPDLISQVIGDARRAENWSSKALAAAVLDARVKFEHVSVSRYYLFATPPVIVDYEQAPHLGKMYIEAKRKWCFEQGIVYVPIFLRERLNEQQFRARLDEERKALLEGRAAMQEDATLAKARRTKKPVPRAISISDPEVQDLIDREALARLQAEIAAGYVLRGASKQQRLITVRKDVEAEFLRGIRDGRVGHQLRYHQSALAAGG